MGRRGEVGGTGGESGCGRPVDVGTAARAERWPGVPPGGGRSPPPPAAARTASAPPPPPPPPRPPPSSCQGHGGDGCYGGRVEERAGPGPQQAPVWAWPGPLPPPDWLSAVLGAGQAVHCRTTEGGWGGGADVRWVTAGKVTHRDKHTPTHTHTHAAVTQALRGVCEPAAMLSWLRPLTGGSASLSVSMLALQTNFKKTVCVCVSSFFILELLC